MVKSKNLDDFINATKLFNAPGQNIVYADNIGNIGLIVSGDIPIRNAGYGLAPHNGTNTTYEWKSMVPRNDEYQIRNPKSGFIATANDHFIPSSYPYFLGYAFDSGYRAERIRNLLNISNPITYTYMESIQNDVHSLYAQAVVPKILIPTSDPIIQAMENSLDQWDFNYGINSTQGPILALFTNYFLNLTYADNITNQLLNLIPIKGKLMENTLNLPQNSPWFNINGTSQNETKNEIILQAYKEVKNYYQVHKLDINTYTWGQMHKVQFNHILGIHDQLVSFFSAGGLQASPGDMYTINVGTYNSNFIQTNGASMRQIIGMDNNKTYLAILPPGESGLIGQNHFADQVSRWLEGNYCLVIVEN